MVDDILNAWRGQGQEASHIRAYTRWTSIKPFAPILFVVTAGVLASIVMQSTAAFGGVMAAIATVGLLLQQILNR